MPVREDLAIHTVKMLRHGDFQNELTEAISECVKASEENGKASEVTVKLKFQVKRGQVMISDTVASKPAKPDNPATIAFNDVHGNLSRTDPRQQSMDLKSVDEAHEDEPRRAEGYDNE